MTKKFHYVKAAKLKNIEREPAKTINAIYSFKIWQISVAIVEQKTDNLILFH